MHKRSILFLLALLLILPLFVSACASEPIRVIIDGTERTFSPAPISIGGSIMVPARSFCEALGATVSQGSAIGTIQSVQGDTTVILTVNSRQARVNGVVKDLSAPAQLVQGVMFMPLSFVGESLGATVSHANGVVTVVSSRENRQQTPMAAVHFIDVGQGDSILIKTDGKAVLIDAGEQDQGDKVVSYLKDQGVKALDLVISTHPHADHIGGLPLVLRTFPVAKVIDSGVPHTSQTYLDYLTLIEQKNIPFEKPSGQSIDLGDGIRLDIVGPVKSYADLNNSSVVARLVVGQVSVLFTGDMEQIAEADLLRARDLQSTILKVGHHGSDTSSSAAFLTEVDAQLAIISVGEGNSYGHPTAATLARLKDSDVGRTDLSGTLVLEIHEEGYGLSWEKGPVPIRDETQARVMVYITAAGNKYHLDGCRYLDAGKLPISLGDAVDAGYTPCGVCKPPTMGE